jgi:hypothetical protein
MLHHTIALAVVIGVMLPVGDQGIDQDVSGILVLIKAIDLYVFEEWWLA